MVCEDEISLISKKLDELSVHLDCVLKANQITESDLQRIGQEELELLNKLAEYKKIAKTHADLSAICVNVRERPTINPPPIKM